MPKTTSVIPNAVRDLVVSEQTDATESFAQTVQSLLTAPDPLIFLRARHWLSGQGLARLVDLAAEWIGQQPSQARLLAELCARAATAIGADEILPPTAYIRSQAHAINAEFDRALELIEQARTGFIQQNDLISAVRTSVGRISVLEQLGRYDDALSTGREALHVLATLPANTAIHSIAAKIHQNLGLCYQALGRQQDALSAYADAELRYRTLDDTEGIGFVLNNRGLVLLDLGRPREALSIFESAMLIFDQAGLVLEVAHALNNIGYSRIALGRYTQGLNAYEQARQLLQPLEASTDKQVLLLDLAGAYLNLNLSPESLSAYREVLPSLQQAGMRHELARAQWGMGAALISQAHYAEAKPYLAAAESIFREAGHRPAWAGVLLEQSALAQMESDAGLARQYAQAALAVTKDSGLPLQQAQAHLRLAELTPDVVAAQSQLDLAQTLNQQLGLPQLRRRWLHQMGQLAVRTGSQQAESFLREAMQMVEQQRASLSQERLRASFVHDKADVYDDLVQFYLAQPTPDNIEKVFDVAERARARTLTERLARLSQLDSPTGNSQTVLDAVAIEMQAVQFKLHALYGRMMAVGDIDDAGGGLDESQMAELQLRAVQLEQTLSRLHLRRDEADAAEPNSLAQPLTYQILKEKWPMISQSASQAACIVSYFVQRSGVIVAMVLIGEVTPTLRVIPVGNIAQVQRLLDKLSLQWDRLSQNATLAQRHAVQLEQSARGVLGALYQELFHPLAEALQGRQSTRLIIIPHSLLHQVPFQALHDGARYLIDVYDIVYAPSVTHVILNRQRPSAPDLPSTVFGVADALIPNATLEARAVAGSLAASSPNAVQLYLNEDATLEHFYSLSGLGKRILHMACHGLFRADNPMFSALKLHDGWLMAANVIDMKLGGAIVTLSACESGRSQANGGDELSGLTQAFLGAGVGLLVVSLWLAHDAATKELMTDWYERMRNGMDRVSALRQAQLALRERWPHPYHWAAFIAIGG